MSTSIDQQRAAYAWQRALKWRGVEGYRELTKGAPALVMGSGLMAALAFWRSRPNESPAQHLVEDMLDWFATRKLLPRDFEQAMPLLAGRATSSQYMALTDEALALLRWLRQFADALDKG